MQGDWKAGTALRPGIINITVDSDGQINHVGVGYEVVLPSGQVALRKGWTWDAPPKSLQAIIDTLLGAAVVAEGVSGLAP